jgi:type IV pilus assembly protein PilC
VIGPGTPQLLVFTRQIEVALRAGLPIHQAFEICVVDDPQLKAAVDETLKRMLSGAKLSKSLSRHPKIFSEMYRNMIRVGEQTGALHQVFGLLVKWLESENERSQKVRAALVYPAIVVLVTVVLGAFMGLVVLPPFLDVLEDMEVPLPLLSRGFVACVGLLSQPISWIILSIVTGLWLVFLKQWLATKEGRLSFDRLLRSIPILGPVVRDLSLMRLSAALSAVLRVGCTATDGLRQAAGSSGSAVLEEDVEILIAKLEMGESISSHMLDANHLYAQPMGSLVRVGEETGRLPIIFDVLRKYFREESEHQLDMLTSLLEPFLIGTVSILVGSVLLALLLPLYSYLTTIG